MTNKIVDLDGRTHEDAASFFLRFREERKHEGPFVKIADAAVGTLLVVCNVVLPLALVAYGLYRVTHRK